MDDENSILVTMIINIIMFLLYNKVIIKFFWHLKYKK